MVNSKKNILFLPGKYSTIDLNFYKSACRGKTKIAVDGGYSFFEKSSVKCDYLIGDFDSLKTHRKKIDATCRIIEFPKDKDKTDLQLAIEFCLSQKTITESIDIIQPSTGELDHFIGNLFLLTLPDILKQKTSKAKIRILNRDAEILFICDHQLKLKGKSGEQVSVIPLSKRVRMSTTGCLYNVEDLLIRRGETRSLRNIMKGRVAGIKISGEAFIYHQFIK